MPGTVRPGAGLFILPTLGNSNREMSNCWNLVTSYAHIALTYYLPLGHLAGPDKWQKLLCDGAGARKTNTLRVTPW
jgi:hypothetical protein